MPIILESIIDSKDNIIYSVKEKEMLHKLRVMLKDTPNDTLRTLNTLVEEQRGERWSDTQLMIYLNQALSDINCEPPQTIYTFDDFPPAWESCILNGGLIFALIGESILQNGKKIIFNLVMIFSKRRVILLYKIILKLFL